MADSLTEKQEKFCNEYLVDLNASGAARRAGYSDDTAYSIGWENLRKPEIQARINELRQQTATSLNITKERIAQELARIGFADIRRIFDEQGALKSPQNWSDDDAAVIAGVDVQETLDWEDKEKIHTGYLKKVKLWEKTKALEQLARLMGYNEPERSKVELEGACIQIIMPPDNG